MNEEDINLNEEETNVNESSETRGEFPKLSAELLNDKFQFQSNALTVSHVKAMTVTVQDLLELNEFDTKVNFNHIKQLTFKDMDFKTFSENVGKISHCKTVRLPDSWPKFLIYLKCNFVKYFDFY